MARIVKLKEIKDSDLDKYEGALVLTDQCLALYGFSRDNLKGPYSTSLKSGIEVKIGKCRIGNRLQIFVTDEKGEIVGISSEKVIEAILAWPKKTGKEE